MIIAHLILATIVTSFAQSAGDTQNDGYPPELVAEAARLHFPLPELLKGQAPNYPILKDVNGKPDYGAAINQIHREADAYHTKQQSDFLKLSPEQQDFQLRKLETMSQLKGVDGDGPIAEHEQYRYEHDTFATAKTMSDLSTMSPDKQQFETGRLQAVASSKNFSDTDKSSSIRQYRAAAIWQFLNNAPAEYRQPSEMKGVENVPTFPRALDQDENELNDLKIKALVDWQHSGTFSLSRNEQITKLLAFLEKINH